MIVFTLRTHPLLQNLFSVEDANVWNILRSICEGRAVRDWMNKNHIKQWESLTGLKQANELIVGPSIERSKDLLKLNRDQLRWIVGLLTGHCHLKVHLFKLGLTADPICER
jgi:hypothetical protein